jgi:hypothetical protein
MLKLVKRILFIVKGKYLQQEKNHYFRQPNVAHNKIISALLPATWQISGTPCTNTVGANANAAN